ncbi:MAG: AAA family ATPase, partial [Methanobacteriota archaeon]
MDNQEFYSSLIKTINPNNILSFGSNSNPIELTNLNVLIGPNGSGKSNLIEVINLLRSSPTDLRDIIRKGGGTAEWIWKGDSDAIASIDVIIDNPKGKQSLRHVISFRQESQAFVLEDERIENAEPYRGEIRPFFYYLYNHGSPVIGKLNDEGERNLAKETIT